MPSRIDLYTFEPMANVDLHAESNWKTDYPAKRAVNFNPKSFARADSDVIPGVVDLDLGEAGLSVNVIAVWCNNYITMTGDSQLTIAGYWSDNGTSWNSFDVSWYINDADAPLHVWTIPTAPTDCTNKRYYRIVFIEAGAGTDLWEISIAAVGNKRSLERSSQLPDLTGHKFFNTQVAGGTPREHYIGQARREVRRRPRNYRISGITDVDLLREAHKACFGRRVPLVIHEATAAEEPDPEDLVLVRFMSDDFTPAGKDGDYYNVAVQFDELSWIREGDLY